MINARHYWPEIRDVLEAVIEIDEMEGFELSFEDIGTVENGKLIGGLGHAVILNSTNFDVKDLDWIGIEKRTGIVDLKEFIHAVNWLERMNCSKLCEFYNHEEIKFNQLNGPNLDEVKLQLIKYLGDKDASV